MASNNGGMMRTAAWRYRLDCGPTEMGISNLRNPEEILFSVAGTNQVLERVGLKPPQLEIDKMQTSGDNAVLHYLATIQVE